MEDVSRVLIINEDKKGRLQAADFLRKQNISSDTAPSPSAVDNRLLPYYSLVIIDLQNHESHHNFLHRMRDSRPAIDIGMTGLEDRPDMALSLLRDGIIDHVCNLKNTAGLYAAAIGAIEKRKLVKENQVISRKLQNLRKKQKESDRKTLDLEEIYDTTLENLMTALDIRDVETFGHSRTVAKYSQVLAQILGIKDKQKLDNIRKGALLHDVGKIAIPDSILKKPGSLSAKEWQKIRLHPALGFGLVKEIKLVPEVGNIILHHHERFDGMGYPHKLKNGNIPLEARIFAVADALDAITSHRPYRKRRDFMFALKEIKENSGTQFDPDIVKAFCSMSLPKWEKIRLETTKLLPSFEKMIALSG